MVSDISIDAKIQKSHATSLRKEREKGKAQYGVRPNSITILCNCDDKNRTKKMEQKHFQLLKKVRQSKNLESRLLLKGTNFPKS
jgi:hypothetical protein